MDDGLGNDEDQSTEGTSDQALVEEDGAEDGEEPEEEAPSGFRWKQARENLMTGAGVRAFELAYSKKDMEYEDARASFEAEYSALSPRLQRKGRPTVRHGGYFQTYMTLLQEMGLMYREDDGGNSYLRSTPAGDQAALLLRALPGPLRVVPYFVVELLSRYRFNNPLNESSKNRELAQEIAESDIFPYWTIYKLMRSLGNTLSKDEVARFVFRLKHTEDIPETISTIARYRRDRRAGMSAEDLDRTYGVPLQGTFAQPKFIMGRAGVQVGVILQNGDEYRLAPEYLPFIDSLLAHTPAFEELDERSWIREYGDYVRATEVQYMPFDPTVDEETLEVLIPDDDPVYLAVTQLLDDGFSGVTLIGPPGTGKTWYARQIGIKLCDGSGARMREVQFHPAYQYEDFVEGYVPDGHGGFRMDDRHLLKMCNAAGNSDETYVLIIDEFSRTDPARVMGEAMTYMETSLRGQPFYLPSGRQAVIPKNLVFLATMNPEDRSVDEIDAAMDRRWGKVYLAPDVGVLHGFLKTNAMPGPMRGHVIEFFKWVQPHFALGHAFFRTVGDRGALQRLWDNQLRFVFEKAFRYDRDTLEVIKKRWEAMMVAIDEEGTYSQPAAEE